MKRAGKGNKGKRGKKKGEGEKGKERVRRGKKGRKGQVSIQAGLKVYDGDKNRKIRGADVSVVAAY
jgi:hypothetical protein